MAEKRLTSDRAQVAESIVEFNRSFYDQGYTDGLPCIPPTEERVWQFVNASLRDPQDVIAEMPPLLAEATVEKIAINAVMAGCEPEYMPALIAAVAAMSEPQFNLKGIQATTSPVTPIPIFSGSIRLALDINGGAGCFGPGWRANATIGRAIRLILLNIGDGKPGKGDKASHGQPGKYTFCFAENEEASPWEPLSVERGFAPGAATVTMFAGMGTSNIHMGDSAPEDIAKVLAHGMINIGMNNFMLSGEPLLVVCPPYARQLASIGFTKLRFKEYLWEKARAPIDWFSRSNKITGLETASQIGIVKGDKVLCTDRPDKIMIVVAGDAGGYHGVFVGGFGNSASVTRAIAP